MSLEKEIIKMIKTASSGKNSGDDVTATVVRTEGSTAWVHVEGGVEETPVEMSISCEPGDDVRVRINKGAAYIIGNNTNPPTNDKAAVQQVMNISQIARQTATKAYEYLQSLFDELSKYVAKGTSSIGILSEVMTKTEDGVEIYQNKEHGAFYANVSDDGLKVERDNNGSADEWAHISDHVTFGKRSGNTIGQYSFSHGFSNASGYAAFSEGAGSTASGMGAHAEGASMASGQYSHAENAGNTASGDHSHAEGSGSQAVGARSHAEGASIAEGGNSHAEGTTRAKGDYSHTEGSGSAAYGAQSHAEGYSIAGDANDGTKGFRAHAEGMSTATGDYSHAEGGNTLAGGAHSHAEGSGTQALGENSHAGGANTTAGYANQTVVGFSNVNRGDTIFEVGGGSQQGGGNAFDVTSDGFIRTGYGYTKIAFGANPDPAKNEYGYYIPNGNSYTFVPWITQDTTYTAGANIDITNNVISAPNVAPIVNGKVPEQYLPSYVDDVIEGYYNPTDGKFYEESTYQTEIAGERGKIYISLDTDKSYRWSGTVFVELTSGGVVYSAGSGIDISATNEISADNTIARMTDLSGYLPLSGGTMTGGIDSQNIAPSTDDTYRLGSSTSKYNSAYVKRIYNLASIESTTDGSKRLLVPAKSGTIAVNEDLPDVVGNLIAVNPILTSGTLIANITISGVSTNLYAPSGGSSYAAGDGIDISNNEISVDDTIARVSAIPDELADLADDSTHRLVTDTEKSTWNRKQDALTFPLSIANGGTGNTLGQAAQLDVPRDSVNPNTAMTTAPASTVRIDECHPNATGVPEANWFHYITTHSVDTRYGSQLALGMTTNNVYSRIYADSTWGAWKRLAFADEIPSVSGYLPLAGGTMSAGAKITFTNSATEDGVYLNNGTYQLRLIIGSGGINRGLWDGSRWMIYENATDVALNSPGSLILNNNTVINHAEGNWNSGLRINSVANNANGSAHITFGGQSGTTSGTTSSYPMYQVGKMSDISGGFAIRAEYNGTYHDVFKASPTTGLTELLSYANGTTVNITAKESDIDLTATPSTTSKITLKTNNLLFAGTNTTSGTITTGTGDPSRPFKFTGYESGSIAVSTTAYPSVTLNDGDLILLFLSSGAGNSFYAARLLRNNNGSLQSSNLATTGTSHATVTMRSDGTIVIRNTNSSYKLNYKILRLG